MAKQLTVKQYADLYGCGPRYIQKMIKNNKTLPFVSKVQKIGSYYILDVPDNLSEESFKKEVA